MSPIKAFVVIAIVSAPTFLMAQKPSPRPPITGIARVSVYASDMAKSRHFYGDFLGFRLLVGNAAHQPLEFRVNKSQSIEVSPLPQGETDNLAYIAFATPDIAAMRRYLISRNVPVNGRIQTLGNGARMLRLRDPEGHRIEFLQLSTHRPMLPVRSATAPASRWKPISRHILHAGFIVHDPAAENRFFRDVLGFREAWHGGMKSGKTDWVDMQVPNGSDWIEYMLRGTTRPTAAQSGGMNHFSLGVPSVHQADDLLQQRDWHPSPREKPHIGRDGKWQLNLFDPDGTRVELMEFRPVRTPCCAPYTLPVPKVGSN